MNNAGQPFTAPGLGDRIHQVTCAWAYSQAHGVPVTLHLDATKAIGGQFGNKRESWAEVTALFPPGSVGLQFHDCEPASEDAWLAYLAGHGIEAEIWRYGDFPGVYETPAALDIAPYLKEIPLLSARPMRFAPERFVTEQWDSNQQGRRLSPEDQQRVREHFKAQGFELLTVGGQSNTERFRVSLQHIAGAMCVAQHHIGVDSAFMHMAQLYMPWSRIYVYNRPDGFKSHHLKRAWANGAGGDESLRHHD